MNNLKCVMPWKSLGFHSDGTFVPCGCLTNMPFEDIPINQRHNSNTMKFIRNSFIKNEWPVYCNRCKNDEENNKKSMRQNRNEEYQLPVNLTEYFDTPEILDINFSNVCNGKCIMCTPRCSSSIAVEVKNKNIPNHYKGKALKSELNFDHVKQFLSNCKRINLRGGEPLLDNNNLLVLKYLKNNNLIPQINIVTNGTIYNEEFFTLAKDLNAKIKISVDGINELFEFIRFPLKFNKLEENLLKFKEMKLRLGINCTVQIFNICNLQEIQNYFDNLEIAINYEILRNPTYFQANNISEKYKEKIIKLLPNIEPIINLMNTNIEVDKQSLLFSIEYFKKHRNQNINSLHLIIRDYLNE